MKTKKAQVDPLAYHRVLEDLPNQPVDRSATYLAVACLKDLTALTTTTTSTITTTTTSGWYDMVTDGGTGFVTCMEHLVRETDAVPPVYPMSRATVLRLAGAFTHLEQWQARYPKSCLCPDRAVRLVSELLDERLQPPPKRRVRSLILGLHVVTHWMQRVGQEGHSRGSARVGLAPFRGRDVLLSLGFDASPFECHGRIADIGRATSPVPVPIPVPDPVADGDILSRGTHDTLTVSHATVCPRQTRAGEGR